MHPSEKLLHQNFGIFVLFMGFKPVWCIHPTKWCIHRRFSRSTDWVLSESNHIYIEIGVNKNLYYRECYLQKLMHLSKKLPHQKINKKISPLWIRNRVMHSSREVMHLLLFFAMKKVEIVITLKIILVWTSNSLYVCRTCICNVKVYWILFRNVNL